MHDRYSTGSPDQTHARQARAGMGLTVVASCVGTALEWYDFFIYGYMASLIFDGLFFPKFSSGAAQLAVFATFSVGFFSRPIGAIVFGHFGDRIGRKAVLTTTLLLMGCATTAMGLLPTYAAWGLAAPVSLVVLRILQGIALGGESVGAILMTAESAPERSRGLLSAFVMAAAPIGIITASLMLYLVTTLLSSADFAAWGWRVPFLFSVVLTAMGFFIRRHVDETASFKAARREGGARLPLLEVLRHHKRPLAIVLVASLTETIFIYFFNVYALAYGTKIAGIAKSSLALFILAGNVLALVAVPVAGHLSDRFGRRRIFRIGLVCAAAYLCLFFALLGTRSTGLIALGMGLGIGLIHPLMYGPEASLFPELFRDATTRFTGVSIGKQIGTAFGGGMTPLAASLLLETFGNGGVGVMVVFGICAAITFFILPRDERIARL
ncbi:MFS transporter [Burkholderia sp. Ac-20379]|uniref:MFS transporter n=1 Tax=Burkholderia sp. Ac-20379 TaxID=2703900 RepID=UPI00198148C1|nr:MFS transporter [Burkholderia sp. Ac-20379]MBN3723831.1 MHS family MFS transporter [Burkholderia sp. Ac-20379]